MGMKSLVLAALAAVAHGANLKLADFPTSASSAAGGTLVKNYPLSTPGGIKGFNPFLTDAEAVNEASMTGDACTNKPFYATCADTPALASGFTVAPSAADGSVTFYAISDRGPNQDCGDLSDVPMDDAAERSRLIGVAPAPKIGSGKGFPVNKFSPTLGKVVLDSNGMAKSSATCYLKRSDGSPASGVSTRPADDTPYDGWCQNAIPYDNGGQDAEDIQEIPGTNMGIICDEYSPSVSIINLDFSSSADCGKILKRYVPTNVAADLPNGGYPVSGILPTSLDQRRKNRGFENVAVSPDGKLAVAIMQSGMDVKDQSYFDAHNGGVSFNTRDAEMIPAVFLDISDPLDAKVLGTKWYPIDLGATWTGRSTPADNDRVKLSAAFMPNRMLGIADDEHVLVVLERETSVRLYLTDFSVATYTNEAQMSAAHITLLNTTANLEAQGVKLAKKALIVDTGNIPAWASEGNSNKAEGFALVNEYTAVFANDNDFGLEGNGATQVSVVQLPKSVKDVAKELGGGAVRPAASTSAAGRAAGALSALAATVAATVAAFM